MSGTIGNGVQSISPLYNGHAGDFVHASEENNKAVDEIIAEEREIAETAIRTETQQRINSEEIKRLEDLSRETEKQILEQIRLNTEQIKLQDAEKIADLSEYEDIEEIPPGINVDLLA